jgi:hypothetical protein
MTSGATPNRAVNISARVRSWEQRPSATGRVAPFVLHVLRGQAELVEYFRKRGPDHEATRPCGACLRFA